MLPINNIEKQVNEYLLKQSHLDILRFITCGSVDDGKSTLIGRMLFEAKKIFEDQIDSLKNESKKNNNLNGEIDFSLLVDGLAAEREQGITIDVAYRFFSTDNRKFIVLDTPGHEQYTRNMATGASNADAAVILIDARYGMLPQTKRHSIICSSLGIENVALAINKMDLVDYSYDVFNRIVKEYLLFAGQLNFKSITPIPISALYGDNITNSSIKSSWFEGPTLIKFLENVTVKKAYFDRPFRMPVQWVNRPSSNFRGFSGMVESGRIEVGQKIKILPSGNTANIKDILLYKESLKKADVGQSITLTLDREIDISRGDVIASQEVPLDISDQFEVEIVWLNEYSGYSGRSYLMKLGRSIVNAQITNIKYKLNINTFEKLSSNSLDINDLACITIKTDRPIPFEKYKDCPALGGLILIDRMNNQTLAAGMIKFSLRRAKNIYKHLLDIDKIARRNLNNHTSKVIWFTGLSGSGKSTIANALEKKLHVKGIRTFILDGDNIRHGLNKDLGFTNADRIENIRRISEVARLLVDAGIVTITSFISPFRKERQMARELFDDSEFVEIFVDTPLDIAESRDPKGLYKKARKGEIPNFTGIDSPYEVPEKPDIIVKTEIESLDLIIEKIITKINLNL